MKRQAEIDGSDDSDGEFGPTPMSGAIDQSTTTIAKKVHKQRKLDHEKV